VALVGWKTRSSTTSRYPKEIRNGVDSPETTTDNGGNVVEKRYVSENMVSSIREIIV
jgi:hypothetical protein